MREENIDGVRVLWQEGPGPFSASLDFGVGHRDEELHDLGLTHFVFQLAEPTATGLSAAGGVHPLNTSFLVRAEPAEAARYLAAICGNISSLLTEDLAAFSDNVDAGYRFTGMITDDNVVDPFAAILAKRFGPHGLGLLRWPPADYAAFTRDQVARHISCYFTAGNAVLTLTGKPPAGLTLALPPGPRATHATFARKTFHRPIWYQDEVAAPAVSVTAQPGAASHVLLAVLRNRIRDGVAAEGYYPVAVLAAPDDLQCAVVSESKPGRSKEETEAIARAMWDQLHELAREGASQSEIDTVRNLYLEPAQLPEILQSTAWIRDLAALEAASERELFGASESFDNDELAALSVITPTIARDIYVQWLGTAIVVVPPFCGDSLPQSSELACPVTHVMQGEAFRVPLRKRLFGGKPNAQLIVGSDRVSIVDGDRVHSFALPEFLVIKGGKRLLIGDLANGCAYDITDFPGASERIWQAVAPQMRRQMLH